MQANYTWESRFRELFDQCCVRYRNGETAPDNYYGGKNLAFLEDIGCRPRELFDFIEDFCDEGTPTPETALLVAAVRRDYFRVVQKGKPSGGSLDPDDLPARESELGGFAWLPRILAKARAKLKGELDPDIMYCCGGDRAFLSRHDIHPADFLRAVWAAGDDDRKLLAWVIDSAAR